MAEIYNTDYDFEATKWFWRVFQEENFMAFRSKYPQGSRGGQLFERFTSRFEQAGVMVEHGFLSEDLHFDRYGSLQVEWAKCEPIISGLRGEWNESRFRENFELLAKKGRQWGGRNTLQKLSMIKNQRKMKSLIHGNRKL